MLTKFQNSNNSLSQDLLQESKATFSTERMYSERSFDKLGQLLHEMKIQIPESMMCEIGRCLSIYPLPTFSYKAFTHYVARATLEQELEEEIRNLFYHIDRRKTGKVDAEDLAEFLKLLHSGERIGEEGVNQLLNELDYFEILCIYYYRNDDSDVYRAYLFELQLFWKEMLEQYNTLKETLTLEGYDKALKYADQLAADTPTQILLKTNFYCYLTINCEYQNSRSLTILQQCLADTHCRDGIRALTRYHLCQLFFNCDLQSCERECEEVVGQFIGNYHMLQSSSERTVQQEQELWMLQYVLYYCLLMLGYMRRNQGRMPQSQSYLKASQNLLKIGNRSSQFINASSLRTRSAEDKKRPGQRVS